MIEVADYLKSAVYEHDFWLEILMNHGQFIRDSLYESEKEAIEKAKGFIERFKELHEKVKALDIASAPRFASEANEAAEQLKQFKFDIIRRQLEGKIGIHLTPSFIGHMVLELEEYQNVLGYLEKGEVPPIFHELHHHLLWLRDAYGHAGTINDNMDGVEKRLKEKSHLFTQHFEQFYLKAVELTTFLQANIDSFPALKRFNNEVDVEMNLFKTFLLELEEHELSAEVLSNFTAPMAEHMAKEEQYYLLKLAESRSA
nr:DUF2935 domain-containing protein [Rummeliibacillus sp. TYF-LIM-RU47]